MPTGIDVGGRAVFDGQPRSVGHLKLEPPSLGAVAQERRPHVVHAVARLRRRQVVHAQPQDVLLRQAQQQAHRRIGGDVAARVVGDDHRQQA